MKFTYTGTTKDGQRVQETVEAKDRFEVYDIARQSSHTVVSVNKETTFSLKKLFNSEKINALISRVKLDDLVLATRNLGAMLKAGLPITRALSVLERQSKNPKLKLTIRDVKARVQKGDQLNESLAAHSKVFDDLYIAMVKAGEESGSLAETLTVLATQMERSSSLRKKIKGAMIYPAIVMTIMLGIGVLMMIYVMPSITATFESLAIDLPTTTTVLIATSKFMVAHTLLVLLGMVGVVVGFIAFARTKIGKIILHWVFIHLPVIGTMVKETNSARTSRTLSSLLTAGVDVIRALEITKDVVQNVYYKPVLAEAAKAVEQGQELSATFVKHEKLYPVFVGEMLLVGEETGQVGEMMRQLAVFYETEVERKTKDLSTIIEPMLMVVIGGTVGFFALAMIAPIYSISDSI